MQFVLSEALARVLGAAGILKADVETIAADVAAKFPDLDRASEEFRRRVREQLDPSLNEATIEGLLLGAWDEAKTGHPGFNRHAFGGG